MSLSRKFSTSSSLMSSIGGLNADVRTIFKNIAITLFAGSMLLYLVWNEDTLTIIVVNLLATAIITHAIYHAAERERLLLERALQQQELEEREQALRHAKEVTMILHSVRHDVKNPLATAEKLLGYANAQNAEEIAGVVQETLQRVLAILDSTFQEDADPFRTQMSMIRLRPAITMIEARYRQFLEFEISDSINDSLAVPADLLLLERILDNVARNSARFATRLYLAWDGHCLLLYDDGPGFSEAALQALRNGQRVDSDTGWGLGLVGIKMTAERHGIQIHPFNHSSRGAAIKVIFPHLAIEEQRTVQVSTSA